MKLFTADFLQFFTKKRQNLVFGWIAGYSPLNPSISGISFRFPNLSSLSCLPARGATRTFTF